MKTGKIIMLLATIFTLMSSSCREQKEQKVEDQDTLERVGDEIEDGAERAVEEVEGAYDDVKEEVDGQDDDN
ncbi:MAG: hypothetical protein WBG90_12310 [Saonia sp.]